MSVFYRFSSYLKIHILVFFLESKQKNWKFSQKKNNESKKRNFRKIFKVKKESRFFSRGRFHSASMKSGCIKLKFPLTKK